MKQSYDVVIAGGAVMGSSLAFHLASDPGFKGSVLVIDKDMSYQRAASALSLSSIRQQFSTRVNILASLHGIEFLRAAPESLRVGAEPAPVHVQENGYLYLAGAAGEANMRGAHAAQRAEGADVELIGVDALAARLPWLNCDGVALASFGRSGEGWFDGYGLMQAFRAKARALGVTYREAQVTGLELSGPRVTGARLADGEVVGCGAFVNCAGASGARALAALAGADIPVYAKKRSVFTFQSGQVIERCPLLIDTSGVYVRTEGTGFVCGVSPDDGDTSDHGGDFVSLPANFLRSHPRRACAQARERALRLPDRTCRLCAGWRWRQG